MQGVPQRLRVLREKAGLTKTSLAKPNYTVSYVSQIESGRRRPSDRALAFFASKLGVTPRYLSTGIPDDLEDRLRYQLEDARRAIRRGELEQARALLDEVDAEATRYDLVSLGGQALAARGDILVAAGSFREAIDTFEEALEGALPPRDRGLVISALARTYRLLGDLSYAIDLVERFLAEERSAPLDLSVTAELQSVLVSLYFDRGDVTKAEQAAQKALAAADEGASPEIQANAYWDASRILAEQRHWDEALELARRARQIMEGLDDRRAVARLHNVYAYLCLEVDPPRLNEAKRHLRTAEKQLERVGTKSDLSYLLADRARVALLERDPEQALRYAKEGLEKVGDNEPQKGSLLYLQGRALGLMDRVDDAEKALREAAAIFHRYGGRQLEATCWRELGELQLRLGDSDSAMEALRSGLEALDPSRARA